MHTTTLADRYELQEELGRGGMARVVAAYDRILARRVAVKLLERNDVGAHSQERFLREARAAASLSHPNAVQVFDSGRDGDVAYIVMELVDGPSLQEELTQHGAFEPGEAVRIIDAVLAALDAAHAQGLVHRDVKPANVLLTRDRQVKLADFGIAKSVETPTDLTLPGQALGTPTYLSPEQAQGAPATPASDLYSTGVVLYELLAGEPPFTGDNPLAVALAHQYDPPPSLLARRPALSRALAQVVERALAKDPLDRFGSAREMRDALRRAPLGAPLPGARTRRMAPPSRSVRAAGPQPRIDRPVVRQPPPRSALREPWVVITLVVLALLAGTFAVRAIADLIGGLGDALVGPQSPPATEVIPAPPADGPTPEAEQPAPQETETTPTETPPDDDIAPERIDALLATNNLADFLIALQADPQAAGPRGPEFAQRLQEVVAAGDASGATQLAAQATTWVARGELDARVAQHAVSLVTRDLTPSIGVTTG